MRWNTATRSTAIYASLEDVAAIHGHGGKTVIVFNQDDEGTRHAVTCAAQDFSSRRLWTSKPTAVKVRIYLDGENDTSPNFQNKRPTLDSGWPFVFLVDALTFCN